MAKQSFRYFDVDLSTLVPNADAADLEIIAEDIIDYVVDRTLSGVGIRSNGRRFTFDGYEEEYEAATGKSGIPDLALSGDMLEDIEVLSVKPRAKVVRIGFPAGYEGMGKVEGNIKGTYGQKSPISGKARPFLGVNKTELKEIVS